MKAQASRKLLPPPLAGEGWGGGRPPPGADAPTSPFQGEVKRLAVLRRIASLQWL